MRPHTWAGSGSDPSARLWSATPGGAARGSSAQSAPNAGGTRTRSELEELFLALCRDPALPLPAVNARVAGMEVDFLWQRARVIAEADGWAAHRSRGAFEADRRKTLRLQGEGYAVLRFSYRQVTEEPASVKASPRACSRRLAPQLAPAALVQCVGAQVGGERRAGLSRRPWPGG